jgi:hypothetical protein
MNKRNAYIFIFAALMIFAWAALRPSSTSSYDTHQISAQRLSISPPVRINVCGRQDVFIVFVEPFNDENNRQVNGYTEDIKKPYYIFITRNKERNAHDEAETLMHELMHVILTTNASDENKSVHDFIYDLSPCLIDTLYKDNPELMQYFLAANYLPPPEDKKTKFIHYLTTGHMSK